MKTAYSYIRFSSVAQEKGDSLRRQTQLRDEWLKAHPEYKLDTDLKIDDLGTSAFRGKNIKKGGLRTFLEHVERGDVEPGSVLLVEKLDRYSRDMAHVSSGHLASLVTEHDIAVVPFTGMLAGRFIDKAAIEKDQSVFLQIVLSFQIAHGESAGKSERNAAAQAGKRERAKERGEIMTSQVPAWINVTGAATKDAGHNAALSLNAARAKIIKRIFREFCAGNGCGGIAKSLNADKVATFGPSSAWHPKYVHKILRWRAVLGEFTPMAQGAKQDPLENYFPRVIDDDVFDAAQALIESRQGHAPRSRIVANILAQLGVCPKCGSSMRRKNRGAGKKGGKIKLVCSKADHGGACDYVTVDMQEIEQAFQRWDCKIPRRDATLDASLKATETDLGAVGFDIHNLVDAIARRPSAALEKRLTQYEAREQALKVTLAGLQLQAGESDSRVLKQRAANLKAALSAPKLDRQAINVALRTMLTKVVVEYPTAELVLWWKHDGQTRLDLNDKRIAAKEWAAVNR